MIILLEDINYQFLFYYLYYVNLIIIFLILLLYLLIINLQFVELVVVVADYKLNDYYLYYAFISILEVIIVNFYLYLKGLIFGVINHRFFNLEYDFIQLIFISNLILVYLIDLNYYYLNFFITDLIKFITLQFFIHNY